MAFAVDELLSLPPYGVSPAVKAAALRAAVHEELLHHHQHCPPFARWCTKQGFDPSAEIEDLAAVPLLPVSIFKRLSLCSVPENQVVRVLYSSATSSQVPSRIPLDQVTRNRQMRALAAILAHRIGPERRPFVVLDAPPGEPASSPLAVAGELSARAAGMRGYLMAATRKDYVLQPGAAGPVLDVTRFLQIIEELKAEGKPFCLLGYTYVLYQQIVSPLRRQGARLELPANAFILHFGGWKRLRQEAVTKDVLNAHVAEVFGISTDAICDIYGFTEQLGVVYPDGADGLKRAPTYAEVFVRNPRTLELVPDGETGLLEFVCPLPHSYPGVAVLLDDLGRIVTREPAADGTTGPAFEIMGRAEGAELRGCGDTLARQTYT